MLELIIMFHTVSDSLSLCVVVTRHYLESQLAVAWGGRVAEELVFGQSKVTTGASGDLQQIFRIARAMVCQLGFSRYV